LFLLSVEWLDSESFDFLDWYCSKAKWVCAILAAKSMQNPKKYANGLAIVIPEYIQLIILYGLLSICGNLQFYGYKISHRLTKMSQARFCY